MISLILTILNGTDIKIKKITIYDSTRDMALCESRYFQSLYIKYIDDGQIITKYINKSDIHSSELYEFIIKNNIFENFEIHNMLVCTVVYIAVSIILLFVVLLIKVVQHFYRV